MKAQICAVPGDYELKGRRLDMLLRFVSSLEFRLEKVT